MQKLIISKKLNHQNSFHFLSYLVALFILLFGIVSCSGNAEKSATSEKEISNVQKNEEESVKPAEPPAGFKHQLTNVDGVNIHYVIGGAGQPLVLLHGFAQNWYMWNRLLPELSKHFTIIAPDLPGVGESDKTISGFDKKTMATYIHGLVSKLGFKKIDIAGHDIGLMVAYAYAAQYESEVNKLALMDALVPGIEPVWSQLRIFAWWFGFFDWPASGELVEGREKLFFTNFWPQVGHVKDPFTPEEANEFIRAYSVKGATTGSFHWFGSFPQDVKDNLEYARHKLKIPVLALGGEFAGNYMTEHCRLIAANVKGAIIKNSGHWVVQENTVQVQKELLDFFTAK